MDDDEDFFEYYQIPNIKSDTVVSAIKDVLIRFELPLINLRVQTYNGASEIMADSNIVMVTL